MLTMQHGEEVPVVGQLGPGDSPIADAVLREFHGRAASATETRKLLSDPNNVLVAATVGDTPVGYLMAHRLSHLRTGSCQYFIYSIDVCPAYRRRGIGSRLLRVVLNRARTDGVEAFVLANRCNVAAMRLYEASGGLCGDADDVLLVFPPTAS